MECPAKRIDLPRFGRNVVSVLYIADRGQCKVESEGARPRVQCPGKNYDLNLRVECRLL